MKAFFGSFAALALILAVLPTAAFAGGGSKSKTVALTQKKASETALKHVYEKVFIENLDHDSSVSIKPVGETPKSYFFVVSGWTEPELCKVVVRVSKATGRAYNDRPMTCKTVKK